MLYTDMILVLSHYRKETLKEKPLRRPTHIWVNNITIDLKETGVRLWTRFTWLKTQTSGGLLLIS